MNFQCSFPREPLLLCGRGIFVRFISLSVAALFGGNCADVPTGLALSVLEAKN